MALYYQNFYILVVFVPFLHTSRTFVLPVHAVRDSAQVLEERVEAEVGSRALLLPLARSATTLPRTPQPGRLLPSSCSPDVSTGAHGSVGLFFKKVSRSVSLPLCFLESSPARGPCARARLDLLFHGLPLFRAPRSIRAGDRSRRGQGRALLS